MENVVPGSLQRLRAADIIRMAGLTAAALGQEYCRAGAVHGMQRQGTRISGLVDVRHTGSTRAKNLLLDGEVKTAPVGALFAENQHCYAVTIDVVADVKAAKAQPSMKSSVEITVGASPVEIEICCQCQGEHAGKTQSRVGDAQTTTLCCHAAALLYQWLKHPAAFIVSYVSNPSITDMREHKRTEAVEKNVAHIERAIAAAATKTPDQSTAGETTSTRSGTMRRSQPGPIPLGNVEEILTQCDLSDLRSMARQYEIAVNGVSKPQLAKAIVEKLKQPEAVRRVAATLEKRQRQLLAVLTLAGGSMADEDLRGLFQRFSLGQVGQLHGMLTALQGKALLFRTSFTPLPPNGKPSERSRSLLASGWYIPQEVRAALRVSMPITPFHEVANNENESAPIVKRSDPDALLADLLLVAHALDGSLLIANDGEQKSDETTTPISNARSATDGSVPVPPPPDMPSATLLSSLQNVVGRSRGFLRFAINLLRLADILYKDEANKATPSLRIWPDTARLFLGPTRAEVRHDLFELWLAQSSYGELFELQEDGLRLRCQATPLNLPILRPGELNAEHSEARQTMIALLSHAPLNEWMSFSAFVRFVYRLNPSFLQRRRHLFSTPHWWIEQEEGCPLRPFYLNDWLQAESRYLAHFLCGPLHWWGICDVAMAQDDRLLAFRLTPLAGQMLNGMLPGMEATVHDEHTQSDTNAQNEHRQSDVNAYNKYTRSNTLQIRGTNELLVTCSPQTWQIIEILETFAEASGVHHGSLCYHLTPKALGDALSRGHQPAALRGLLQTIAINDSSSDSSLAQMLTQLQQWIAHYGHVRIYTGVSLLETTDAAVMRELSATTLLDDQIVKPLYPTLFVLKKGATECLIDDLKQRGHFPLLHDEQF